MRRKTRFITWVVLAAAALALLPVQAEAQRQGGRRGPARGGTHVGVYVGGYWGYPSWGYPYWSSYWGYPYWGYPSPWYGYGGYRYDNSGEIRLQVTPREAQVYVDGYLAGTVDDFDGMFQRLRVRPGSHELTLYLTGYQTVQQDIELRPNQDVRVQYKMQPLAAGQTNEPPPLPAPSAADAPADAPVPTPAESQQPPARVAPPRAAADAQGFGSLVMRVQPAGADVLIDGDRWQGPEGQERLVVQVAAGTHRIEVRKDGYVTFTTQVRVGSGDTAPLNVALPRVP
jgi:hypothetical protein